MMVVFFLMMMVVFFFLELECYGKVLVFLFSCWWGWGFIRIVLVIMVLFFVLFVVRVGGYISLVVRFLSFSSGCWWSMWSVIYNMEVFWKEFGFFVGGVDERFLYNFGVICIFCIGN